MTTNSLREKLHNYINSAEQARLKELYFMVEEFQNETALSMEQKLELDARLQDYLNGKGKNYLWDEARNLIVKGKLAD